MGKNKSNPLNLKWRSSPVRILGVRVSYSEKENNELNFHLKIRKMQLSKFSYMESKLEISHCLEKL